MNRRDFFKTSAALTVVPSISLAGQIDLEMWVEENFTCKNGDPGPWVSQEKKDDPLYHYHTIACAMITDNEEEARRKLTLQIIDWMQPMAVGKPELWWRSRPMLISDTRYEYGDVWMSAADYEDFPKSKKAIEKKIIDSAWAKDIVVTEAGDLKTPSNVKLDPNTDQYRYVLKEETVYRLRMRIAIPSQIEKLAKTALPEGAKIRMI